MQELINFGVYDMNIIINWFSSMSFSKRLIHIRKKRGLTQNALAELTGLNVSQIYRWESGNSRPILEGVIKLAKALHVSIDDLVFEESERAPQGKMKLLFEAVEQLKPQHQDSIQEMVEMMVLKYESQRFSDNDGQ